MLYNINKALIFAFFGIIFGFFLSIFFNKWSTLYINNEIALEINPFELISLFINILLAIYVTISLSKQNDLENRTKNLLIDYFSEFKLLINNKITRILQEPIFNTPSSISDLKIIRKKLDSIINLAIEFNLIELNNPKCTDLKDKVRDIWEILTEHPIKVPGKGSAQKVEVRLEQVNRVEFLIIEIEKIIFQLTMHINKK